MSLRSKSIVFALCLLAVIAVASLTGSSADVESDLTIFVSGDLMQKGGVVIVSPLPVSRERWRAVEARQDPALPPPEDLPALAQTGKRLTVHLDRQFSEVQFLHPLGERTYSFRFRPHPASKSADTEMTTRLLSVGGISMETGHGQTMPVGFTGMATSGDQIIQVIAPPTSERAARVLATMREDVNAKPLECTTSAAVSVCSYSVSDWADVKTAWDVGTAALEKEYRGMNALNQCYRDAESAGKGDGSCHLISDESAEAVYEFRAR